MDYEKLLKRAKETMPDVAKEKERFEIPKIKGRIEGSKTIITNFTEIANNLRRPQEHLLKYLLKEIAAPGIIKSTILKLGGKIPASKINEKIRQYSYEFVLCAECGKPDTEIKKEGEFTYLKCSACGAKKTVKSKI